MITEMMFAMLSVAILALVFSLAGILPFASATPDPSSNDTLAISGPQFEDLTGNTLQTVEPGIQVMITHSINNTVYPDEISLVWILELRDEDGVTQYIAWQSSSIQPDEAASFGTSWLVPSDATDTGSYSARVFAVTSLGDDAEVLSAVFESEVTVS